MPYVPRRDAPVARPVYDGHIVRQSVGASWGKSAAAYCKRLSRPYIKQVSLRHFDVLEQVPIAVVPAGVIAHLPFASHSYVIELPVFRLKPSSQK